MQGNELGNILKIHCGCFRKEIWPWVQHRLLTPYWRFYWNPEPGGFLKIGTKEIALSPDCFYILPGYLEFSTFARTPFSQFYIHFNLSDRQRPQKQLFTLSARESEIAVMRGFIARENIPENRQLAMIDCLAVLTSSLLRLPPGVLRLAPEPDPRIEEVVNWINRHLGRPADNSFLAGLANMSRNGFLRLFESEIGEPPQSYCRRKRIERACELLHFSDRTLEEIADETGFADRYHFTRVFTRMLRIAPAAFRRQVLDSDTRFIPFPGNHPTVESRRCPTRQKV